MKMKIKQVEIKCLDCDGAINLKVVLKEQGYKRVRVKGESVIIYHPQRKCGRKSI